MKTIVILVFILFCPTIFAQTYDLKEYPSGTKTVELLKSEYTAAQIRNMLDNSELLRNKDNKNILGIRLQDPNTLNNIIVSDTDSTLMLFEYIKKLRLEIANMKQRLQSAGIP